MESDILTKIDGYITEGCRDFARQRYDHAIHTFTRAINTCRHVDLDSDRAKGKLVALYDYRAACYERKRDLKNAYLDATAILKVSPVNCRAFLRLAKIRLARGEETKALETLQRGLKLARKQPLQQAKLLKKMEEERDRLQSQIVVLVTDVEKEEAMIPRKCLDPMELLPLEIMEQILVRAGNTKFILQKCMYVSKKWHRSIQVMPSLYRDLDLSRGGSLEKCLAFLNNTGNPGATKRFNSLKLHVQPAGKELTYRLLMDKYPITFRSLQLHLPDSLYHFFVVAFNRQRARQFLEAVEDFCVGASLPKIGPLTWMSYLPNMRSFDLRLLKEEPRSRMALEEFAAQLKQTVDTTRPLEKLESITVTSLDGVYSLRFADFLNRSRFPKVSHLTLRFLNFDALGEYPSWQGFFCEYETLNLQYCTGLSFDNFQETQEPIEPKLRKMSFCQATTDLRQPFSNAQVRAFSKLEYLNLTRSSMSLRKLRQVLVAARETLVELNMSAMVGYSFTAVGPLSSAASLFSWKLFVQDSFRIRKLYVQEAPGLTDQSLKQLGEAIADFVTAKILSTGQPFSYSFELLDLSFNNITRRGLIGMFQDVDYLVQKRTTLANAVSFHVETLVLGGNGIRPEDDFFVKSGYCTRCIVHNVLRYSTNQIQSI